MYDVLKQWVVESRLRINMKPAAIVAWLQPKKEKPRYDVTMVTFWRMKSDYKHFSVRTLKTSSVLRAAIWSQMPLFWVWIVQILIKFSLGPVYISRSYNHEPLPSLTLKWQLQTRGRLCALALMLGGCNLKRISAKAGCPLVPVALNKPFCTVVHRVNYNIYLVAINWR